MEFLKFSNYISGHAKIMSIAIMMFLTTVNGYCIRFFAPNEEGYLVELREGPQAGKWGVNKKAILPNYMETILQEKCKIYLYSDENIEPDEIFVSQVSNIYPLIGTGLFHLSKNNKKISFNKVLDNIYELELKDDFFQPIVPPTNERVGFSNKLVISYQPNKKHKKEGKTSKYWYAILTQLRYDKYKINDWSTDQAIESINQLVQTGNTEEQLFASIKPKTTPNNQVQYVIVQNTEQPNSQVESTPRVESKESVIPDSDVDKNIPYRDINNENAFALIIANESYSKVASVPFANRDGNKLKEYMKKTLGLSNDHITLLENATLNDMRYELNKLKKISDAYDGDCSFIVYYCGHGIPDEKNGNGYLLPVDGYGNDVSTAYSLSDLYAHLGGLNAKKVVLFTDACFSGAGKEGDMLVEARGIAIKSKPNEATGNLIAFSACQGDETAYSYQEKGHGLLTYYFLKKLQETGGKVTLGELEEYIKDNVGKTAIVINGKSQTPSVSVSPSLQNSWRDQTLYE